LLGTPDPESTNTVAETVINGDPSYAGPLAGVALKLPVYHVIEDAVKACCDPGVYANEVSIMEQVLEKRQISSTLDRIRKDAGLT
jgi:betaine reductase